MTNKTENEIPLLVVGLDRKVRGETMDCQPQQWRVLMHEAKLFFMRPIWRVTIERKPVVRWWMKDKYGWPIEFVSGRGRLSNFTRIVFHNIRKITR